MLARCLQSLAAQIIPDDIAVSLIVVDNDPGGSGRLTVKRFRSDAPFPVHYLFLPKRGIARDRNVAVERRSNWTPTRSRSSTMTRRQRRIGSPS
jgi:hypothetical protein